MNQILFVQEKRAQSNPVDTKKIVLFFAITLIVFGLVLAGEGVYAVYHEHEKEVAAQNAVVENTVIELSEKDASNVLISVQSKTGIAQLIYNWGDQTAQTEEGNGQTTMEKIVPMPAGENILTVKVIDSENNQVTKQGTFTLSIEKPEIALSVIDSNKIKIKVTSNSDLSNITYKWNTGNEQKIAMDTFENKKAFETEIEIPTGQNTLSVTATDVYENKSDKSQEIKGVPKPKISPLIRGEYIYFEVTSEEDELQKVEFTFNGKSYIINADILPGDKKKATHTEKMIKGTNTLTVKATTVNGATAEGIWQQQF